MDETDRPDPDRRLCVGCGEAKGLSRFPPRARGRSTVCRACWAEGKRPAPRPARRMTEKDSEKEGEVAVAGEEEGLVAVTKASDALVMVTPLARGQILAFAKALRQTAHEARSRADDLVADQQSVTLMEALKVHRDWVDNVGAKALDRAAAQLELLCR